MMITASRKKKLVLSALLLTALVTVGKAQAADQRKPVESAKVQLAQAGSSEEQRIAEEEKSFMELLATQRGEDAAAAERKKATIAAEVEKKRVEAEEASFMKELAAQRAADTEAAKRKAAEKKAAAAKAAEAESRRIVEEEKSFMKQLEAQREADAEAAKQKAATAKAAEEKKREAAAKSCEARIAKVKSTGVINFGFNSAELAGDADTGLLDKLAQAAASCEGELTIVVEGHTDALGPQRSNIKISTARAEAVASYLREKGVPAERIAAKGFGSSRPAASNDTRAGRAKNRRIEFSVR